MQAFVKSVDKLICISFLLSFVVFLIHLETSFALACSSPLFRAPTKTKTSTLRLLVKRKQRLTSVYPGVEVVLRGGASSDFDDKSVNMAAASEVTPLVTPAISNGTHASDGRDGSYTSNGKDGKDRKDLEESVIVSKGAFEDVVPNWMDMWGRVTPYLRPADRKHTLLALSALVCVICGKLLTVLPPLAIKYAVDTISANAASSSSNASPILRPVLEAIGAFFGLKLLSLLTSALQDLSQRTVSLDAERRFGNAAFAHLQTLSLSYHLEKHIGEITRMLNRGTDSVSTFINSVLFFLAPTIFEAIVVSAVFWKLGTPSIALSTLLAVTLYLAFTVLVTKTRVKYRRKLIEANDAVGQKETETLVNYETVSMFGRTKHEIKSYAALRQTYKDRRVEMLSLFALLELGQKFIRLAGVCTGLVIAGMATVYGTSDGHGGIKRLSPGSFVVIQMYIDQLFQPLTMLGFQYRMLTQAFTDLEKAVTMLQRVPEVRDLPAAKVWQKQLPQKNGASGEIVFENVTFRYKSQCRQRKLGGEIQEQFRGSGPMRGGGGFLGLGRGRGRRMDPPPSPPKENKHKNAASTNGTNNANGVDSHNDNNDKTDASKKTQLGGVTQISFRVPAGKTAALVGPSGSGKTTLIRLVLRMYDPDCGTVTVDDNNVKHVTQQSLRENIGVVAQETILFNASLRENIIYGKPHATEEEIQNAVKAAALEEFVNGLPEGLDTLVGERGMKLSGGERQRVGLARCVIKNPQLILLDEATSALDSATERAIQRNVAELCRGRTTLMIAHRLSTARHADEILVLEKGRICERGTHEQLLRIEGGKYREMWRIQTEEPDEE